MKKIAQVVHTLFLESLLCRSSGLGASWGVAETKIPRKPYWLLSSAFVPVSVFIKEKISPEIFGSVSGGSMHPWKDDAKYDLMSILLDEESRAAIKFSKDLIE